MHLRQEGVHPEIAHSGNEDGLVGRVELPLANPQGH